MRKTAIILGSSRVEGNTRQLISLVEASLNVEVEVFTLQDFELSPFDYDHDNRDDDFLPLMRQLLEFDHLMFATPMYWYSMSAQLKVFFDRFSDLLSIEKDLGRRLRGTPCSLLATGADEQPPACFEQTFRLTFDYLDMPYKGMLYGCFTEGDQLTDFACQVKAFIEKISIRGIN